MVLKPLMAVITTACLVYWFIILTRIDFQFHTQPYNQPQTTLIHKTPPKHHQQLTDNLLTEYEKENWGIVMYKPVRIVCAIPTTWNHSLHRIERIVDTWGPRCDHLVWAVPSQYTIPKPSVGEVMVIDMERSADPSERNIWEKTYKMWIGLADHYSHKADWFVKLDDDTYLFVEHLRKFLEFYNPHVPHYFGHTLAFRWHPENIVFNTGIAYVLSHESLQKVAPLLRNMPKKNGGSPDRCVDRSGAGEDTNMGICLRSIGINPDNTLDEFGRQRFLPFQLQAHKSHMRDDDNSWFWKNKPHIVGTGKNCCVPDEELIAVHGFKAAKRDDQHFYRLESISKRTRNSTHRIPPPPSPFWHDEEMPFEIDEYLNSVKRSAGRPAFTGYPSV